MPYRLIHLSVPEGSADKIVGIIGDAGSHSWWRNDADGSDNKSVVFSVVLATPRTQDFLDDVTDALGAVYGWRLVTNATEVVLPEIVDEEKQAKLEAENSQAAREEIYVDVSRGAILSRDYLLMVALATVVAAIGLSTGQVAVVIGAMVIAPLLGPILAFAFGTALGNRNLLWIAAKSFAAGLAVSLLAGGLLGLVLPPGLDAGLVTFNNPLGLTTAALPLASGAAAALMVTQNNNSALVGVMVAAALLPPLAAIGLLVGGGEYVQALRALATVIANVVAITLAAQVVFILKGIRPRGWLADSHDTSVRWSLAIWVALLALVVAGLVIFGGAGL
ncbi:MAG: TIGR00341 family protein [Rhodobacteraceae bacterium]|nr:TIGR00341 family protein [Paracoccaceae bacterium]